MVMELAPGVPLAELIGAPMPRDRVVALVAQLLRGLVARARAPASSTATSSRRTCSSSASDGTSHARIVDFGIAVLRDRDGAPPGRRLTDAGLVVGTPIYMAPEQATRQGRSITAPICSRSA